MRPIAIFRHLDIEGPGYLAEFLSAHGIPWNLIAIDQGAAVPTRPDAYSGLVFMGGPMSVNDDLPWIGQEITLIRAAVATGIPVLGHCLGGQLMAKALNAEVSSNPVKEIGWGAVEVVDSPAARDWFAELKGFTAFHWHGETFDLPEGARHLLRSPYCANQAFALGPHLALQCHVEMTAEMVRDWCRHGAEEIAHAGGPAVQPAPVILAETARHLPALTAVAERLYRRWIEALAA